MFGLMRTKTHIKWMHEADRRILNLAESQNVRFDALAHTQGRILDNLQILIRTQDLAREMLREKLTEGD